MTRSLLLLAALLACDTPATTDAGTTRTRDAGSAVTNDAGVTTKDAGVDAGLDAGLLDAGPPDAGARERLDGGWGPLPSQPPPRTCRTPRTFPKIAGRAFTLAGQPGFFHDEGHEYGFFHTFDALTACTGAMPRKVHVLLPRDYETSGRRYPVLYVHDGQTAFFTDNPIGKTWDLAGVLSELERCGEVEQVIVVAPHPLDRDAEYTHTSFAAGRSCCGVEQWKQSLVTCLMPFIERNYRVETGPSRTGLMGSSHGGLAAFWIGTGAPDRFGHVAALSPSLWAGLDDRATGASGTATLSGSALYAHARPALAGAQRPALWVDWGLVRTGGTHNSIIEKLAAERSRELVTLLHDDLGVRPSGFARDAGLVVIEDPSGGHDEDSWHLRVPWVLRWMFPK